MLQSNKSYHSTAAVVVVVVGAGVVVVVVGAGVVVVVVGAGVVVVVVGAAVVVLVVVVVTPHAVSQFIELPADVIIIDTPGDTDVKFLYTNPVNPAGL